MNNYQTVFTKYHGNGNDFIVVDLVNVSSRYLYQIVVDKTKALCDRHRGIGADGVIFIEKLDGQWSMSVINADGSVARNCGNGLRIAARYIARAHGVDEPLHIHFAGRDYHCVVHDDEVSVAMGSCIIYPPDNIVFQTISLTATFARGHIGNEHVVVLLNKSVNDLEPVLREVTARLANLHEFNIGFLWRDDNVWHSRVHERGVGWTKSCGTGAMIAASLLASLDLITESVVIHQLGGVLRVALTKRTKTEEFFCCDIVQQGKAEETFKGICQV